MAYKLEICKFLLINKECLHIAIVTPTITGSTVLMQPLNLRNLFAKDLVPQPLRGYLRFLICMRKVKNRIAIGASAAIIRMACLLPPFSVFLVINTAKPLLLFRGPRDLFIFVIEKE